MYASKHTVHISAGWYAYIHTGFKCIGKFYFLNVIKFKWGLKSGFNSDITNACLWQQAELVTFECYATWT